MRRIISFLFVGIVSLSVYSQDTKALYFQKVKEPNEKAFELLIPKGWQIKGGIYRLDPMSQGGAAQSIAAKNDFAAFNNTSADVMIRWMPDNLFMDMRGAPAAAMFPQGSNYSGMTVLYKTDPVTFIRQVAFPYAHPNAMNVIIKSQKDLPGLANAYLDYSRKLSPMLTMSYSAAVVQFEYTENGRQYEEIQVIVLEDWGSLGAGLWGNKNAILVRAPKGTLAEWAPVLETIQRSVKIDINWLIREMKGQQERLATYTKVQQNIQEIDREIVTHQQNINHEIHNDMYLNLTDQEEYVNPYTGETEVGTNQWDYRWENDLGEIIYTDMQDYNPNMDVNMNVSGFKRSKVRPR